jgi:hypothetical protein
MKRAPAVSIIGAKWPISGRILNIEASRGTRRNSVKIRARLRLSLGAVSLMVIEFTEPVDGFAEAFSACEEGGAAILKPENKFLLTWESPRILEE